MINNVYPILNKKILYINDVVECSEMSLAIATRTSVWAHKLTMFFSLKIQLVPKGQKILKQVNNIQWGRFKGILFFMRMGISVQISGNISQNFIWNLGPIIEKHFFYIGLENSFFIDLL